jgi:TRAP-type C4-dicarboxylate transport system substrate-binding protein
MMAALAGVATAAAVTVGSAQAAEVKLKAASFLPTRIIFAKFFGDWVDSVNKTCAGKIKISIVGPAAIKSLEQWNAVKNGVVDMHYGPATYYKGAAIEAGVTDLANVETADQRKNGAWAMLNGLHNKKMNSQYLTQITDGVKFYIYTSKPNKDGRFEGFRLRSVPIYDAFFKSLGAQPVRMGAPAVYTALERKVVDGLGWPLWGVTGFGWNKFLKYRHGPGFYSAGINILVNLDKWRSLSGDQRACLNERSTWLEGVWPSWRKAQNAKEEALQNKAGMKYVDLGTGFRDKAVELYWADLRRANPAYIDKIRPLLTN